MPMRKEAPNFGSPEEGREIPPGNELFREEPSILTPQEITPEETPLHPKTQPETKISQAIPRTPEPNTQIETQPHQEESLTPEKPKKEGRGWLERLGWLGKLVERKREEYRERGELLIKKLEEEGAILTEEDKRKLYSISVIWTIHAVISNAIGIPIAGGSILSLIRHRDFSRLPLLLSYNVLIPGGIRLATTVAFEQLRHIKFDGWSKIAAILSGWGMPVEIAIMSKKSVKHRIFFKVLLNEVREHYITNPLAHARNLYGRARKMIRRK